MVKKFRAQCIKSDPLGWLEIGKVYECQQWNGKTLVGESGFVIDSARFSEHFIVVKGGNQ